MEQRRRLTVSMETARRAWDLRGQGYSEAEISRQLGIGRRRIQMALATAGEEARRKFGEQIAQKQLVLLEQLDTLFQEALEGWRRSQLEVTITESGGGTPAGSGALPAGAAAHGTARPKLVIRKTRQCAGDPAFLDEARKILARIRCVMALDAPRRVQAPPPQEPRPLYAVIDVEDT
jgi:hypothetical protein